MSSDEIQHPEEPVREPVRSPSLPIALKACNLPLPTRIAFIGNYLPRGVWYRNIHD